MNRAGGLDARMADYQPRTTGHVENLPDIGWPAPYADPAALGAWRNPVGGQQRTLPPVVGGD